ncbi:hypothetical protein HNY73_019314 [Argiope bruennichi]|uniref:Uncharacterized protein n=1 Tax=Argiope bruennichi TaxID=94029 RepID=A0A8T0EJA1_ARGBR|nr:hypothetical protein HNY73_019314 [Argiope bruennichi]
MLPQLPAYHGSAIHCPDALRGAATDQERGSRRGPAEASATAGPHRRAAQERHGRGAGANHLADPGLLHAHRWRIFWRPDAEKRATELANRPPHPRPFGSGEGSHILHSPEGELGILRCPG